MAEQEKGTAERIKQAQKQGTKSKTDPKHLAKLEKEVKLFRKGLLPNTHTIIYTYMYIYTCTC